MTQLFTWIEFDIKGDNRGSLTAIESNKHIPFEIKRVYYIYDTKAGVARGFHAHKNLQQVIIAIAGSCKIRLDDANEIDEVELNTANKGIVLGSLVWRQMYDFSPDCVLLCLANDYYDESDYIRDYNQFLALAAHATSLA